MLAAKNGARSVLRSPGKSLLFTVLICALTLILALGACIQVAVTGYLNQCDSFYKTIGVLEYLGADYPDGSVYDVRFQEALTEVDLERLAALPGSEGFTPERTAIGVIDGMSRTDKYAQNRTWAVLQVESLKWDGNIGAYNCTVADTLSYYKEVGRIRMYLPEGALDFEPDAKTSYWLSGEFYNGPNGYRWFQPVEFHTPALDAAYPDVHMCAGIVGENQDYVDALVETMTQTRNAVRVSAVSDLEEYLPFQQQEMYITEGRLYTAEEAAQGARLCVITQYLATGLDVGIGDVLDLGLYFADNYSCYEACDVTNGFDYEAKYTVVGIAGYLDEGLDRVFVPFDGAMNFGPTPTGYIAGQFRLNDREAEAFGTAAEALLPAQFRLQIYDQGYSVVAEPFMQMQQVATVFLAVCMVMVLGVLALFGFLFVYRQRETAATMNTLGSGKAHILCYFATGCGIIAVAAAAAGAVGAAALEGKVLQMVAEFAAKSLEADTRFSDAHLTIQLLLEFAPSVPWSTFAAVALGMVLLALASCLIFTALALRKPKAPRRKKVRTPKRQAGTSHLPGGLLKYPLLSIRRGGLRTLVVILVAALGAVFYGQLVATADVYRDQLAYIQENTKITGYFTNVTGRNRDSLMSKAGLSKALWASGLLESIYVTEASHPYALVSYSNGEGDHEVEGSQFAKLEELNEYGVEYFYKVFNTRPTILPASNLNTTAEFRFTSGAEVTWLEGYSMDILTSLERDVCVMPEELMVENGIALGDQVVLEYNPDIIKNYYLTSMTYRVVGSYKSATGAQTIFVPLSAPFPEMSPTLYTTEIDDSFTLEAYLYEARSYAFLDTLAQASDAFTFLEAESAEEARRSLEDYAVASFDVPSQSKKTIPCLISQELMDRVTAYDTAFYLSVVLSQQVSWDHFAYWPCTAVGVFSREETGLDTDFLIPDPALYGELRKTYSISGLESYDEEYPDEFNLSSVTFTLRSAQDLDRFRDVLEETGFAELHTIGKNRNWVVIEDQAYLSNVESLQRQIRYMDLLYKCMYVLLALVGLVVSYLMVAARKQELAIMRGLGAQRLRTYGSFFLEQLFLCLVGLALGLGGWALSGRAVPPLQWLLTAVFALCWAAGSLAASAVMNHSGALQALSDRE